LVSGAAELDKEPASADASETDAPETAAPETGATEFEAVVGGGVGVIPFASIAGTCVGAPAEPFAGGADGDA
jgi:hypothetical protein